MEVRTINSVYIIEHGRVYKKKGQEIIDVGKFMALSQAMPSGGAIPKKQQDDLPLRLWYTSSKLELFRTSPITAIYPILPKREE